MQALDQMIFNNFDIMYMIKKIYKKDKLNIA
jgi:hypothetical protein